MEPSKSKRKFSFLQRYRVELPEADNTVTLSKDYQPTAFDVVCGRGRGYYNCQGNLWFRGIVSEYVPAYLASSDGTASGKQGNKKAKTGLLMQIVQTVRQQSNNKAKFIKFDGIRGRWIELDDIAARDKAGHAMREACAALKKQNTNKKHIPPIPEAHCHPMAVSSSARSGMTYAGQSSRSNFGTLDPMHPQSRQISVDWKGASAHPSPQDLADRLRQPSVRGGGIHTSNDSSMSTIDFPPDYLHSKDDWVRSDSHRSDHHPGIAEDHSFLSNGNDSILSAIGSGTFLNNEASSDFFNSLGEDHI